MSLKNPDETFLSIMEEMLDANITEPMGIEEFDTKEDIVAFCLSSIILNTSNMVSGFSLQNLAGWKLIPESIKTNIGMNMVCLSKLAETIDFKIPDWESVYEYIEMMPQEMKASPFMACTEILGAVSGLSYILMVEFPLGNWTEAEGIPEDLIKDFMAIMASIKHLCNYMRIDLIDLQ